MSKFSQRHANNKKHTKDNEFFFLSLSVFAEHLDYYFMRTMDASTCARNNFESILNVQFHKFQKNVAIETKIRVSSL